MYAGEYFADRMHGFGVYNFTNGHRYEGGWHEGQRQGFGLYTFRNGDTQSGYWEDGILSVTPRYPTPVSHAKVLKAAEVIISCFISQNCFTNQIIKNQFNIHIYQNTIS